MSAEAGLPRLSEGSRGAGEIQTVHTVAIAQSLGEKRWDVMQWASAFATTGDTYRLTHAAAWNLYAAPSDAEAVNGYILNGKGGYFEVDIPLYSSRPFVHRGVMPGPSAGVQVVEWSPDRIVLNIGPDFASGVLECVARRRGSMLAFGQDGNTWVWDKKSNSAPSVDDLFSPERLRHFNTERGGSFDPKETFIPLAATFFGDVKGISDRISARPLPSDQIQLLIFAKAPASFAMQGKGFHGEEGWVLYVINLFRAEP